MKQNVKELVKKYFSSFAYFYGYLRYRIFLVIALSIFIGILDGLGLTMFLPLLQLADGTSEASGEGLGDLQFIVDWINATGLTLDLKTALFIMLFFFVMKAVVTYIAAIIKVNINRWFVATLRIKMTNLFTRYSFKAFVGADVGRIQNNLTGEIGRTVSAYKYYSECIQTMIMVLVYTFFVLLVDWKFTILVVLGGVLTNLFYSRIYKKTQVESRELSKRNASYQGLMIQYVGNFKYLKATGMLKMYAKKLNNAIKDIEETGKRIGILGARVTALREPMLIAVVCIVILLHVYAFGGSLMSVMVSLLFFYRALGQLMTFQSKYNSFLSASGALENITEFEQHLKTHSEKEGKNKIEKFTHAIVLDNVGFGYDNKDGILRNISLNIERNRSIAFVGESGSGKTTLVNLISGLLRPELGKITIDGMDQNELNINTYQSRIGYIAQESVVFNDSIFNNVTFWAPPTPENIERFWEAVHKASLDKFIHELPKKEKTRLGNRGINLSGGQKQRISIARELYKDIDILILDEATSALDSETEKEIQMNIDALKGSYTILIIAHRLSTIKNADEIYFMDRGEIIAHGSFEELTHRSERFKRMVELQEI